MDKLVQVRFKFLLGELHLHSWRPRFVSRPAPADAHEPLPCVLPPEASGLWWQGAAAGRYPLGPRRVKGWLRYVPREEKRFYVRVEGSFEDYLAGWGAKARYNLKRAVRKLQERNAGQSMLEVATQPAQMESFLRQAAAISQDTYQARLLQSGLSYSETLLRAMQRRAASAEVRGYLLRDRGQPIAFAWCAGQGERLTYEVIGYEESAAAHSPGSVLLYLILEDLFGAKPFKLFDFGVGDAPYKRQFGTGVLEFAEVYFFNPDLKRQLLVRTHWALERFSAAVGLALEHWGLKARVKRFMRRVNR